MRFKTVSICIFNSGNQIALEEYITEATGALHRTGQKIAAIKFARAHYGINLMEAKEFCEYLGGERGQP